MRWNHDIINNKHIFELKPLKQNLSAHEEIQMGHLWLTTSVLKRFTLNQHVATVHKGITPLKCEVCDYRSSRKDHLK